MKTYAKTFLFWMPLMVLATIVGWTVLGALPGATMTGDLIAWLMELPVITVYALAAGGATMLTMHWTGMNIDNDRRAELFEMALCRNKDATRLLIIESVQWVAVLIVFSIFFFPHW